jgi:UDP-N-acetylglucosamine--dolichyl-phosphate N-acetylglucosaminephosphotransferase
MIAVDIALAVLSFVLTYVFLNKWIPLAKKKGIIGIDVHKVKKAKVTDAGGIVVLLVFSLSLLLYGLFQIFQNNFDFRLLAVLSASLLGGILGLLDRLIDMRWRMKVFLPLVAALPLMIARVGHTTMAIPFFGTMDFGLAYTFILVPLAVTAIGNMTNMFAGFNGLEAGLGLVNSFWFIVVSLIINNQLTLLISVILFFSLLAFLRFNWYPAKVLPGDVGHFTTGIILASILIIGNMEKFAISLYSLFIINFLMFMYWTKFTNIRFKKFADVDSNGYIKPHVPYSMYWLFPYYFKLKEETTVKILLLLQFLIGLFSCLLFVKPA